MITGILLIAIGSVLFLNGAFLFDLKVYLLGLVLAFGGTIVLFTSLAVDWIP